MRMNFLKRSAACLLALTLFFASVPLSGMAEAVDVEVVKPDLGQTELVLGETVTVTIDVEEEVLVYSFTPETTGYYVFEASGDVDSQAYLYDAEGTEIAYSDDYTGTNFVDLNTEFCKSVSKELGHHRNSCF